MKSKWFDYKDAVLDLRRKGTSMTVIEQEFGIPRSTLSGWFKQVPLTETQRTKLMKNSQDGWKKAREKAVITKNLQKAQRLATAQKEAIDVHSKIDKSNSTLELALAMLYFGEGGKKDSTNMGAADPFMLLFFITSLENLYHLDRNTFRYDLHLRDDQCIEVQKEFWASKLEIPVEKIGYVSKDKRTIGKPTRNNYPGVCQISIGNIAIQRRLKALYNVYCAEVIKGD
jgi:hypothetical protein